MAGKRFLHIRNFEPLKESKEKGFSLIELLIALTIFSYGIMAVAAMQTASMRGNVLSSGLTEAVINYSQDKAEELLSLSYTNSNLDTGTHPPVDATAANGVVYSTSWAVTAGPYTNSKSVAVTTTWNDISGTHTVTNTFVKDSRIL